MVMSIKSPNLQFIQVTETVLRLYVLLSQFLDRCYDQAAKEAFPEQEFQAHLAKTREQATQLLATNQVVRGKVEAECENILKLAAECQEGRKDQNWQGQLEKEREILRIKTLALSDLLAVFRSV